MDQEGFTRHLEENGKREISRHFWLMPDVKAANRKLNQLLAKPWTWWVLPHNCIAFVEEVLQSEVWLMKAGATAQVLEPHVDAFTIVHFPELCIRCSVAF